MSSVAGLVEFLKSEFSSVQEITAEWVTMSVDGNYTDFASISALFIPSFYSDDRVTFRLRQLHRNLAQFETECDDPVIWNTLTDADISGGQLSVLLWYSVEWALAKNSAFELLERGTVCACAYLHLASIKGSKAYHVFNSHLYEQCLQVFRILYRCLMFECREVGTSNRPSGKGKDKKKQQQEVVDVDIVGIETESVYDVVESFDKEKVKDLFKQASEALFVLLSKVPLSNYADIPLITTLLIRDMARIDFCQDTTVKVVEHYQDFVKLSRLSDRSFALMHRLIDGHHTAGGYLVISRIVYPRLAFWTFSLDVIASSSAIPTSFVNWKNLMVKFIKIRAEKGDDGEMSNIFKMLENLYQRCTDRLEYRTRLAQSVLDVLLVLPRNYRFEFVHRIDIFSKHQRVAVRNFSIEVAPLLLQNLDLSCPDQGLNDCANGEAEVSKKTGSSANSSSESEANLSEINDGGESSKEEPNIRQAEPSHIPPVRTLYTCVIRSCFDKASTVRLRAMFHLIPLIENDYHCGQLDHYAREMFDEAPKVFIGQVSASETEEIGDDHQEVLERMFMDDSEIVIDNLILHIILSGTVDDTAGVRKYSLLALQAYFPRINGNSEAESAVNSIKDCCLDSSLMVRRQAAETLDHLLSTNVDFRELLENCWLMAVLPMTNDRERSVQLLISRLVTNTILNPLMGESSRTTWNLLHAIELETNNRRLLHHALIQEYQEGNIKPAIIKCLNHKLETCPEEVDVIWMLLADLSATFKMKPEKAVEAWYSIADGDSTNKVRYVAKVLSRSCEDLDFNARSQLSFDVEQKISHFRIAAPSVSPAYFCLAKLMDAVGEEGAGKQNLEKFGKKLLRICREHIRESLLEIKDEYDDFEKLNTRETLLIRVVLTIGEIVQYSPKLMSSAVRLFDALKTIVASDIFNEEELSVVNSAIPSVQPSPSHTREHSPSRPPSAISDQEERVGSQGVPSQNVHVIPSHVLNAFKASRRALLTQKVRAHAVLTIGKFCLMNEKIAKSTIPVFIKQLRLNGDHIIRNNIALVICDLCIRYTSMVDHYSPIVAACLKDRSTLVRQQTLESLTSLIKEQFIRWEGQIMYRFFSTILDENKIIREYAKFCLRDVLLLQFPDLFSNHFIECLMYFNKVPVSGEARGAGRVQEVIDPVQHVDLHGSENFGNRMTIYKFMLSTFDDRLKLTLMAHICTQIISPIMNGNLKYDDPCVYALLKDSLTIMSVKEIRLNMDVGKGPDDEDEPPAVVVAAAKEMITQTFRKAMMDYVMPSLLDLRVYLNERRSRLRSELYSVFRAICREHKDQIDEFLDGDQQLKAEVEYDIRRYELRLKAEWAAARRRAEQSAVERRRSRRSLAVITEINKGCGAPSDGAVINRKQTGRNDGGVSLPFVEMEKTQSLASETASVLPNDAATQSASKGNVKELKQELPGNIGEVSVVDVDARRPGDAPNTVEVEFVQISSTNSGSQSLEPLSQGNEQVNDCAVLAAKTLLLSPNPDEELYSTSGVNPPGIEIDMEPQSEKGINSSVKSSMDVDPDTISNDEIVLEKENQQGLVADDSSRSGAPPLISPSNTSRKVDSKRPMSGVLNEPTISNRAISTPNKTMSNLTFADLNLSAIQGNGRTVSRKTAGSPQFSSSPMRTVEEEQEEES